jgi:hypothetical protein
MKDIQVSTRYGSGVATIAHTASCYGQPVILVGGQVYGPAEMGQSASPPTGPMMRMWPRCIGR